MATDRNMTEVTEGVAYGNHVWLWISSRCPEGREKTTLGGGLRHEERLLSRMRICVDRVVAFDDLCEVFVRRTPHVVSKTVYVLVADSYCKLLYI
jgi:hypothetical protein